MAEVQEAELVRDPVCGMMIEPQDAVSSQELKERPTTSAIVPAPKVRGRSQKLFATGRKIRRFSAEGPGERRIHLPHGPRSSQDGAGEPARSAAWRWNPQR